MDGNNRSSEEIEYTAKQNSIESEEKWGENKGGMIEKVGEQRQVNSVGSDCIVATREGEESRASQSENVAAVQLSETDLQADFSESPHLLSEVPVEYSLQPLQSVEELKEQVRVICKKPLIGIAGKSASAQIQINHQKQVSDGSSKQDLSPTSVTHSISSILSPATPELKLQPVENCNSSCFTEHDKQNTPNPKPLSAVPILKTPSDGYNWRKYGQKQVKSPEGSRSYYRCTFSNCHAKKIECCDRVNCAIDTVYRNQHNHDPPQKLNCIRENKPELSIVPVSGSDDTDHLVGPLIDPVESTFSKEPSLGIGQMPETKQLESSGSEETTEINVKEEDVDGPGCKKRHKRCPMVELGSFPQPGKKPKYVVHTAGDVGLSGDGYRWRKYGQKMVKGKPHPRNYYRCTSAGCPVRKHIEKAVDNTSAVVITYKGVHDHDMPVPRKRQGMKSDPFAAETSIVCMDNLQINKTEPYQSQTQWSVDHEGELTGIADNAFVASDGFQWLYCYWNMLLDDLSTSLMDCSTRSTLNTGLAAQKGHHIMASR